MWRMCLVTDRLMEHYNILAEFEMHSDFLTFKRHEVLYPLINFFGVFGFRFIMFGLLLWKLFLCHCPLVILMLLLLGQVLRG